MKMKYDRNSVLIKAANHLGVLGRKHIYKMFPTSMSLDDASVTKDKKCFELWLL